MPLAAADGHTLAEPLVARTDLPAFATSSVDGWAVRGTGPWRIVGRVLAGGRARPLTANGTAMEIATGAMVPAGTETIVRVEDSTRDRRRPGHRRPRPTDGVAASRVRRRPAARSCCRPARRSRRA